MRACYLTCVLTPAPSYKLLCFHHVYNCIQAALLSFPMHSLAVGGIQIWTNMAMVGQGQVAVLQQCYMTNW